MVIHEDVDLILGLDQWVKNPTLLWDVEQMGDVAWIWHYCDIGWQLQL